MRKRAKTIEQEQISQRSANHKLDLLLPLRCTTLGGNNAIELFVCIDFFRDLPGQLEPKLRIIGFDIGSEVYLNTKMIR